MERGFAACELAGLGDAATRGIIGLSLTKAMAALHPQGDETAHHALSEAYKQSFFALRAADWRTSLFTTASPRRSAISTRADGCWGSQPASRIAGSSIY